jgi:hypothetical protein
VVDYFKQPGIDVMLTIRLRYSPIFGRNNWRLLKKQCYDPIFANKTAVVLAKTPFLAFYYKTNVMIQFLQKS